MFDLDDDLEGIFNTEGLENLEEIPETGSFSIIDNETEQEVDTEDPITAFLDERGHKGGNIKIEDEDGVVQEVNFNDLTSQEKYDLLNNLASVENDLTPDELNFLNYIRQNKLSVNDYLANYEKELTTPDFEYNIDNYSDDELFVLDLREKYDLTDDEIIAQLELEKNSPTVYKKKVDSLRKEYRELEEQYNLTLEEQRQLDIQESREVEINKVVNVAKMIDNFHGIELDIDDKNETLSYLFDIDEKGVSNFAKDLDDPKKLYEIAWYSKYGKQAFDLLKETYEKEIIALRKGKDKPSVVVNSGKREDKTIYDLY